MSTRLLSFLNDIEQALLKEPAGTAPAWNCQRMVNFSDGLARMTLSRPSGTESPATPGRSGAILVQSFLLADGSMCLKANLSWDGSPATTTVAVHAKPSVNWPAEAAQIAAAWLGGPPATATVETVPTAPAAAASTAASDKAASG